MLALSPVLDVEQAAAHQSLQLQGAIHAVCCPQNIIATENPTLKMLDSLLRNPAHGRLPLPITRHPPQLVEKVGLAALVRCHVKHCHTLLNANQRGRQRQQCTLLGLICCCPVQADELLKQQLVVVHVCSCLLSITLKSFRLEKQHKHVVTVQLAAQILHDAVNHALKARHSYLSVPPFCSLRHPLPLSRHATIHFLLSRLEPIRDATKIVCQLRTRQPRKSPPPPQNDRVIIV
mmetsp:Transcript_9749/g.18953  ORF Transcript_9749/g.18953 Transcript_9749/m.18953 type:complete len:234 (-) Transcript_9749:1497-2198(-)